MAAGVVGVGRVRDERDPAGLGAGRRVAVGVRHRDRLERSPEADVVLEAPGLDEGVGHGGVDPGEHPGGREQPHRLTGQQVAQRHAVGQHRVGREELRDRGLRPACARSAASRSHPRPCAPRCSPWRTPRWSEGRGRRAPRVRRPRPDRRSRARGRPCRWPAAARSPERGLAVDDRRVVASVAHAGGDHPVGSGRADADTGVLLLPVGDHRQAGGQVGVEVGRGRREVLGQHVVGGRRDRGGGRVGAVALPLGGRSWTASEVKARYSPPAGGALPPSL